MKKYLIIIILLLSSISVKAEKLTIIYDSNDGSGRTKTVELEKGNLYKMLGDDVFKQLNDNKDNPMDDKVINRWTRNPDNSDWGYCSFCEYEYNPYSSEALDQWESLNNETELRLYAKWEPRRDISNLLTLNDLAGEGVVIDSNGNYSILDKKDFTYAFDFTENENQQIDQLSYFKLPKYFTDALPFYIKEELEEPSDLNITVSGWQNTYHYVGKCYIKDDIFYVDLPRYDTIEAERLYAAGNLHLTFSYGLKWTQKVVNNRWIYVATTKWNYEEPKEIYEKGRIISKYVDIETKKEISDKELDTGVIGSELNKDAKKIDDYTIINNHEDLVFEREDQTMVFLYKKERKLIINPNTRTNTFIILGILSIFIISGITYFIKKRVIKLKLTR